jgi:hypothetical protein
MLNTETADTSIQVIEAGFSKYGGFWDSWTECVESYDEEIEMTWYNCGDPLLIHTEPGAEKPMAFAWFWFRHSARG